MEQNEEVLHQASHWVISLDWQPIECMHDFHIVAILAFICHCVLTVTSSAYQSFLCFGTSFSAAISVPHSVRVRWWYGPWGGGGHLATIPEGVAGDRLPWGGEGQRGGG